MMIWFSASCSFTILPNSLGLPALPLRMTLLDGSNRVRSLPSLRVLPRKMRALVCVITCLTRAPARISHRQHENMVAFAARAFRTVFGVSDCALQQRATQQL